MFYQYNVRQWKLISFNLDKNLSRNYCKHPESNYLGTHGGPRLLAYYCAEYGVGQLLAIALICQSQIFTIFQRTKLSPCCSLW